MHISMEVKAVTLEPLAFRIDDAKRLIGCGTTRIYQLIGSGALDARKSGNRTVILAESLRHYVTNLPKANITTGQRGAAK